MESGELIQAVYLTLLHSLWQGASIAIIAGVVIMNAGKASSSARYNFLAGSMAFFVLCTGITFIKMINAPAETAVGFGGAVTYTHTIQQTVPINRLSQVFSLLSSYSNSIVLLWFAVICFKAIQLLLSLQRVSVLKTKQIINADVPWTERINYLSEKIGINSIVTLAESGLISIPLTVGYFKPVILVPAGMLAAIPTEQVEAILLHELAHIKRQDYLINIFQTLVEILFFFNPAIWWLSSLLRCERENCCDDLAVENSSSKTGYVRALLSFEEYRNRRPRLAVAFSGSKSGLLARTKRIIYNQNETLNTMEKFILTSGLVISGLLTLAFTNEAKKQIAATLKPVVSTISGTFPAVDKALAVFDNDTIPTSIREVSIIKDGLTTFNAVHKGKAYKIVMKDDLVTDLYVDNIKIAEERLNDHTSAIIDIVQINDAMNVSAPGDSKDEELMFGAIDESLEITVAARAATGMAAAANSTAAAVAVAFAAASDTLFLPTPAVPAAPPAALKPERAPKAEAKAITATAAIAAKEIQVEALRVNPAKNAQPAVAPSKEIDVMPYVTPISKVAPLPRVQGIPAHDNTTPAASGGSAGGTQNPRNGY